MNKILKFLTIGIIFIFFLSSFSNSSTNISAKMVYENLNNDSFDGYILYTPEYSKMSYLINNNEEILQMWKSDYIQGMSVYLLDNGDILRSDLPFTSPTFWGGGITGRVEKFSWNGSLLWEFEYSNEVYCLHHDIEILPNGNILMTAWEYKTRDEAIEAGRNPNYLMFNYLWPDFIIEVEPTEPFGGNIVWEWHVWDHLIQDFDPSKDNFGNVSNHPELININYPQIPVPGDWNHINSIDYNKEFDQILLSVRGFSEIWVIDHSTTIEESTGHTGGRYGKGGDLLYRWGNPRVYYAGNKSDQKLFDQHDARWIEKNYPGQGNILVFSNGNTRPEPKYSSVDEIEPPVDINGFYYLEPGLPYGPEEQVWIYTAENPPDFFASHISGAQRLYNGNTLICNGPSGTFFEVTPNKETIWQYENPFPNLVTNDVFTIQHYPPGNPEIGANLDCEGLLKWTEIKAGEIANGYFQVQNIGDSDSLLNWEIEFLPNWGTWSINPSSGINLTPEDGVVTVEVSVVSPNKKNEEFIGSIRIKNIDNSTDWEIIPVYLKTLRNRATNFNPFLNLLDRFQILKKIFYLYF
ncbi:MAG: hypothetical protein AYK22_01290 [Thermoplasmatales archaeon SG8-52-3]|nr:MAG: hypothetical protein AYK22_01290 [Thermoplasmatales archaeon SG8-52-3]